jgi:hypothetical protein
MKIAVIGSRALPVAFNEKVLGVVGRLLLRGHEVCHGGAMGADHFVLQALINLQASNRGILFSAWESVLGFPAQVQPDVQKYLAAGGRAVLPTTGGRPPYLPASGGEVLPYNLARKALLQRNVEMVNHSDALVAFLHGESRGSTFTIKKACEKGLPVLVFLSGSTTLPQIKNGKWVPLKNACMGVVMHYFKKGA